MVRHITYCTVQPAKSPSLLTHALAASTSPPPREVDWGALRWLVLDEADRLLAQPYQGWLEVLERYRLWRTIYWCAVYHGVLYNGAPFNGALYIMVYYMVAAAHAGRNIHYFMLWYIGPGMK